MCEACDEDPWRWKLSLIVVKHVINERHIECDSELQRDMASEANPSKHIVTEPKETVTCVGVPLRWLPPTAADNTDTATQLHLIAFERDHDHWNLSYGIHHCNSKEKSGRLSNLARGSPGGYHAAPISVERDAVCIVVITCGRCDLQMTPIQVILRQRHGSALPIVEMETRDRCY